MPISCIPGPAGGLCIDDDGAGGLPVVFVHSLAGDSTHWTAQLEHLRRNRRAIALDLRGHGLADPPRNDDFSISALATDIEASVSRSIERFVLVGHSMGASAAIAFAGAHPDRIAGLVLIEPPGILPTEETNALLGALESTSYHEVTAQYWEGILTRAKPAVRKRVSAELRAVPHAMTLAITRALFSFDPLPALARCRAPKLAVIASSSDTPTALHRLVENLPHVALAGTGHWLHLDRPEQLNRILDAFLAELREADAATYSSK